MTSEKWVSHLNDNVDVELLKKSFLNNNGKIEWTKYLYLNDIGDFGFPLLMLLALSPMSFKKGPHCPYKYRMGEALFIWFYKMVLAFSATFSDF